MKKETKNIIALFCCLSILFISCNKRNFFPDPDDPGLSRLTSRGYDIVSMYINNVPYINSYQKPIFGGINNTLPIITKKINNSAFDTLRISWQIEINNTSAGYNQSYNSISLLLPISKNFSAHDFLAMNGKRFPTDSNAISVNYNYPATLIGKSNIYFIIIKYNSSGNNSNSTYSLSGLFNGNIGDSILITKGRFDFEINADQIQF